MRTVRVNTTAYEEEDFFLITTLDDNQIREAISEILQRERDGLDEYDNDELLAALKERFSWEYIQMIEIDYLSL
jgi:glycosyltransferase involved in cell wall biosynthesis